MLAIRKTLKVKIVIHIALVLGSKEKTHMFANLLNIIKSSL